MAKRHVNAAFLIPLKVMIIVLFMYHVLAQLWASSSSSATLLLLINIYSFPPKSPLWSLNVGLSALTFFLRSTLS